MYYEQSRDWANKFVDQQIKILNDNIRLLDFNKLKERKNYNIEIASKEDDQNLETDILIVDNLRIALRVRNGFSSTYGDIALRSHRPSGVKTEVDKIKEGLGDYYLYGWTNDGHTISEWMLIDLDRFRSVMDDCINCYDFFQTDGTAINTYSIRCIIDNGCCINSNLYE